MRVETVLREKFGYDSFRKGQKEIIEDVVTRKNVIGLLPTGAGKSICYQLPAYIMEGSVVVVSPLLSLMEDQVAQLRQIGEKRVIAFNSFRTFEEKRYAIAHLHTFKFIFVSPEMLQYDRFAHALARLKVALFVVDEAHCISQWGHEFRTDYMKIKDCLQQIGYPPVLALTATATKEVLHDITVSLGLQNVAYHLHSIDRPNIAIKVEHLRGMEEKKERLYELVQQLQGPGIIYCSSRVLSEQLAEALKEKGMDGVEAYHGGMEHEKRMLIQQQFMKDQLSIISSTSAFGMGVNKPNIRFVIHVQYPTNMEAYLQEIGRAGRDGKNSIAILLSTPLDDEVPLAMVKEELPTKAQVRQLYTMLMKANDTTMEALEMYCTRMIGLDEAKWRFLTYQLELLGVIVDSAVQKNKLNEDTFHRICTIIESRVQHKLRNLYGMKEWLHTETCRREAYLRIFGETVENRPVNCCDRCGINLTAYERTDEGKVSSLFSWPEELRQLFRIEGMGDS
ncbi:RecQ family ATP-dependent DNA helicase [Priestia taiwanensis]|uniref:ATP-dependent DNA helicase RecQ n=1 Tax=Priestia taiwanensis TaxID=1347902 RepID=A0A917EKZ9_9BACI|nr:ATP-dependent DNA helicase RecQ [Priestia taiwanensis]GGE55714.1 ATP-dependent DNA helicase RecQ [Priestia taiwanensis]